jgi:hypothetical protein
MDLNGFMRFYKQYDIENIINFVLKSYREFSSINSQINYYQKGLEMNREYYNRASEKIKSDNIKLERQQIKENDIKSNLKLKDEINYKDFIESNKKLKEYINQPLKKFEKPVKCPCCEIS